MVGHDSCPLVSGLKDAEVQLNSWEMCLVRNLGSFQRRLLHGWGAIELEMSHSTWHDKSQRKNCFVMMGSTIEQQDMIYKKKQHLIIDLIKKMK